MKRNATQTATTLTAVAIGSQFPDLIDKTFAWAVPLLPSGRSLGHSLITVTILLACLYYLASHYERTAIVPAFGLGTVSHSLSDLGPNTVMGLLAGEFSHLQWTTYLVWPLLVPPPYPHDDSFRYHIFALQLDPYTLFQFGLVGLAVLVWIASGMPGVSQAKNTIRDFADRGKV